MLNIDTRPFTGEEKKMLKRQLPSLYTRIERFVLKTVLIAMVLLIPLLVFDKYHPVASGTQLVYCIGLLITAIALAIWWTKKIKEFSNKNALQLIDHTGTAEALHVRTGRAVERKDPEDFGPAFYLEVEYEGEKKTLYLWGQYLYLYADDFPNTEFKLVRRADNKEFIDLEILGTKFEAEKILPPFEPEIWKEGTYPDDGAILDETIDQIISTG